MDEDNAVQEVRQLVQDLLSRDPTLFNSAINAHFASACTYKGRGLEIHGVSQIKHAAWLANLLDLGSSVTITDDLVLWNKEALTAVISVRRNIRPTFLPFVQLTLPTKIELTFNGDVDSGMLFCTRVADRWPLLMLLETMPVFGRWYKALLVPLLTAVVLFVANLVFFLHSTLRRCSAPVSTFMEPGLNLAEKAGRGSTHLVPSVVHGPLRVAERLAQAGTNVCNLALPQSLQLPYPRLYAEAGHTMTEWSIESTPQLDSDSTFIDSPEQKVTLPSQVDETKGQADFVGETQQTDTADNKIGISGQPESKVDAAEPSEIEIQVLEKPGTKGESPKQQVELGRALVGSAQDGFKSHQEIDVVTNKVTNVTHEKDKPGPSLYDELKQGGNLPSSTKITKPRGTSASSTGPRSESGSTSRKKSSKRKAKPVPQRSFNLSKPSNDTPSPTSPRSAKGLLS